MSPDDARTPLWKTIGDLISDDHLYRAHFEAAQEAASTLGPWCTDRYWEMLMTDAEVSRRAAKEQASSSGAFTADGSSEADRVLSTMHEVQHVIRDDASSKAAAAMDGASRSFSSKFKVLRAILDDAFSRRQTRRCIVFVQKRYTALLLADAFRQLSQHIAEVRASYVVGSQAMSSSIANMFFRDQVLTLQRFRRDETNCLFTTQVAEGIDIPECDLIIRFDLYDSAT